jgi:hypothetical protein
MCHCAPVFRIHNIASTPCASESAFDLGGLQECSLPESAPEPFPLLVAQANYHAQSYIVMYSFG